MTNDMIVKIEELLFRRVRDGQIEGRTLETAVEIADLLSAPTHRHVRRGTTYRLLGPAEMQISKPMMLEPIAGKVSGRFVKEGDEFTVYEAKDGKLWVRFPDEFNDGRFVAL